MALEHYENIDQFKTFADAANNCITCYDYEGLKLNHVKFVSNPNLVKIFEWFKNFDTEERSKCPTFTFLRDYMIFLINSFFIYASRLGKWELHVESLKALVKYFFVYDKQKYARMILII